MPKSQAMDMRFYWVNNRTRQGHFFIYWGPGKMKKNYFTKHHPPIYKTLIRHEYLHKANQSLVFFPLRGCINHGLGLTSSYINHGPVGPKYDRQEPGYSTSDCLALVPKKTRPRSNRQEPGGSTYDRLELILKNIRHIRTQNKIAAPLINNTHETDTTKKCNSLHQKYVTITKNT